MQTKQTYRDFNELSFKNQERSRESSSSKDRIFINKRQVICKISFQIDGEQEELRIYQNSNLDIITNQLLEMIGCSNKSQQLPQINISLEQRIALKQEIKAKIFIIMESNIEKDAKAFNWKKKLRNIIEDKNNLQYLQELPNQRILTQSNRPKSIKYFNYNSFSIPDNQSLRCEYQDEDKNIKLIHRAKILQNSLNKDKKKQQNRHQNSHRLYYLGKQFEVQKQQISKLRQDYVQRQMLSQCTFHPKVHRLNTKPEIQLLDETRSKSNSNNAVFNRLYNEAIEKQQMIKLLQRQLREKQKQEEKQYSFIPKINQCSNQIVKIKKKVHQKHGISIYDNLYQQYFKKAPSKPQVKEQYSFHPKICPNSLKIARKNNNCKSYTNILQKINGREANIQNNRKNQISKTQINQKYRNQKSKNDTHRYNNKSFNSSKEDVLKQIRMNQNIKQSKQKDCGFSRLTKNLKRFKRLQTCNQECVDYDPLSTKSTRYNPSNTKQLATEYSIKSNTIQKQSKHVLNFSKDYMDHKLKQVGIQPSCQVSLNETNTQPQLRQSNFNTRSPINRSKQKIKKQRMNPFQFFKLQDHDKQNVSKQYSMTTLKSESNLILPQNLNEQTKTKIFLNIFRILNTSGNQQITCDCILHSQIMPNNIEKILYPMAQQMQQLNVGLDSQQFIWSISRIIQNLSQKQQQEFFQWGKKLHLDQIT